MSRTISKPGPPPTSCLTCHRRRKKCDRSRPCCERCLKGGYECLGYADNAPRARVRHGGSVAVGLPQARPTSVAGPAEAIRPQHSPTPVPVTVGLPADQQGLTETDTDCAPKSSILGAAVLYRMESRTSLDSGNHITMDPSEGYDRLWPQERNQFAVHSHSSTYEPPSGRRFGTTSGQRPSISEVISVIQTLCRIIPPSVDATEMMREGYSIYVINEYHLQRDTSWFMTPSAHIQNLLKARMKGSKRMVWTMRLGTKLFQALDQDPSNTVTRRYIGWIDNLEQRFLTESRSNPPVNEIADRLMVQLELVFLKFSLVDSISGYASLRNARSRFLQLIVADSSSYMENSNSNLLVSFPRVLGAARPGLKLFALYDTTSSLVLGVPPLVDYGYDGECTSRSHGLEWVHGMPVALLIAISQAHSWRASSRMTSLDRWQELESRVLAWQPQEIGPVGRDSATLSAARLSVQEGWRQVVLIYIYMGICGVSSHDSRVQASVQRIIHLEETVADLRLGIHMLIHCVIAGLAAQLEKHRLQIYEKLLSFKGSRAWFFQGPQFAEVLYHLWHGAGLGGVPVTWNDYVRSRCAVLPI